MAATLLNQSSALQGCSYIDVPSPPSSRNFASSTLRFPSSLSRHSSLRHKARGSSSFSDDPVAFISDAIHNPHLRESPSDSESTLILIRHGESMWNEKNLFTGCCDVPLTKKGVEEAIEAGKRISYIPIDIIFTSVLIRAKMTAMLSMTQHHQNKVPVIIHNENEQATAWTRIYSEKTINQSIPVITAWQLNERMYGDLQGLNKQETAERYGKEKVHEWRRSFDIPPPKGESLEMCSERAVAYFKHFVMNLELSTGVPLLYIYREGKFISRGSPVGTTEAGVYAYTRGLAHYRQQFDEMSH
ncbi:2,3-bisphosphoglycerate-dependent phosphoglycerate mutase 1 [Stylosanthes scabra]|uniref:phosphoglycerate mutase (2,3-diphosphoglycerate-dependent) n=1 Tax=Stylosanthes scabra TaxID=79078 RepID=A0ABU6RFF1_9FABA|nr:2,3-bisphosphoglycerate-dependent phosphoglycerate mutase 1 [Stylosanthes scabra]